MAAHVLSVVGTDQDDSINIGCKGGEVAVDQIQPVGGPEACSDLRAVEISAGGGNDRVSLGEIIRSAFPELASVSVAGEGGDDTLIGSDFADVLFGGGGADSLRGGAGADELAPGSGWNEVNGGDGLYVASFSGGGNWFVIDGLAGRRTPTAEETSLRSVEEVEVVGGGGADPMSGASFSGVLRFFGRGGNDLMNSGSENDVLDGGPGDDWLDANAGNDVMDGGPGSDVLRGDEGNDDMNGGPGDDVCLSGPGADRARSC